LAADDRVDLLQRLGEGEFLALDGHPAGLDADMSRISLMSFNR
jgi:hypothetical protein